MASLEHFWDAVAGGSSLEARHRLVLLDLIASLPNLGLKTSESEKPSGSTSSREYFVLDDLTGEVIRACPKLLVKKTKITHAWALSIHKFQGSEAEVRNVQLKH